MDKYKNIRPVVLGMVKKDNKILVGEGYDKIKKETFYRSIGGGVNFLEKSTDALKREFKEEIHVDIHVREFLGFFENMFTYNGKTAHELILFYNVDLDDSDYKEKYHISDDDCETDAVWIDVDKFINGELKIYPEELCKYLK